MSRLKAITYDGPTALFPSDNQQSAGFKWFDIYSNRPGATPTGDAALRQKASPNQTLLPLPSIRPVRGPRPPRGQDRQLRGTPLLAQTRLSQKRAEKAERPR